MDTKEKIIEILESVDREGITNMIQYLEDSSFFSDPASSHQHNSYEGGLADHSLNVYEIMTKYEKEFLTRNDSISDSIKITSLLHAVNHIGCYQKVTKNVPLKGTDGKNKKNENGRLIFIEKESYDYIPEANLPYPAGQLSSILIKQRMKLNKLEDLAIQWHRGIYDQPQHLWYNLDRAMGTHKLIMYLQFAIKEACLYYGNRKE